MAQKKVVEWSFTAIVAIAIELDGGSMVVDVSEVVFTVRTCPLLPRLLRMGADVGRAGGA